jgi:hypothetical protein
MEEAGGVAGTGTVTSQPTSSGSGSDDTNAASAKGAIKIGTAMGIAFLSGFAMLIV